MTSEWSLGKLVEERALFVTDGYRTRRDQLVEGGAPILRVSHVQDGYISVDKTDEISREYEERFAPKSALLNDSVITTKGTVGRAARISKEHVGYVYSPQVCVLRSMDHGTIDPRWLYCWVRSPEMQQQLDRYSGQTDMAPYVKLKDLRSFTISVPPIDEQRAIAQVLGALDDRIEWCYRVAGTLLELSRAAFFEWVASSPDAEIGICDLATVEYGAPYKSALFNDEREGLPVIRIRDVGGEDTAAYTTERHPRDVIIEPGDIVVGMDGEFRAHPWRGPTALLNQRVCSFRPEPGVARSLVLHALEQPLQFYENSITGTTVIHLGKKHIDRFKVPYSEQGNELLRRAADPMLDHIVRLSEEKLGLQRLRDTLLPKLLSGELPIEDPSRLIGAVA